MLMPSPDRLFDPIADMHVRAAGLTRDPDGANGLAFFNGIAGFKIPLVHVREKYDRPFAQHSQHSSGRLAVVQDCDAVDGAYDGEPSLPATSIP